MWGYIAGAELTLWAALGSTAPILRTMIVAIGTLVTLIVVNNAYLAYHRTQITK